MNAQRDVLTGQSAEGPTGSETGNIKLEKKEPLVEQVRLSEIVSFQCTLLTDTLPVSML